MNDFTPKPGLPLGERFTDVYVQRGKPTSDSPRMRRRLASLLADYGRKFEKYAEAELGIPTPWSSTKGWTKFLEEWPLEDVLNVVTVLCGHVPDLFPGSPSGAAVARRFLISKINRIFEQENVSYRVDQKGGVHFHIAKLVFEMFLQPLRASFA
jgi:hypothetical protein